MSKIKHREEVNETKKNINKKQENQHGIWMHKIKNKSNGKNMDIETEIEINEQDNLQLEKHHQPEEELKKRDLEAVDEQSQKAEVLPMFRNSNKTVPITELLPAESEIETRIQTEIEINEQDNLQLEKHHQPEEELKKRDLKAVDEQSQKAEVLPILRNSNETVPITELLPAGSANSYRDIVKGMKK